MTKTVGDPEEERKHEDCNERRPDQLSDPIPLDGPLSIDVNHRVRLSPIIDGDSCGLEAEGCVLLARRSTRAENNRRGRRPTETTREQVGYQLGYQRPPL